VTLDNQSATSAGTTSVTATFDSAMQNITVPTKTGYTFGGYYSSTGGGGNQYYTTTGVSTRNWDLASNTTLYAKWTANSYTVTLNNQSATSAGTASVTATYASAMPAITIPAKTNYRFGGYYTGTSGSGTQYYDSAGNSVRNWNLTSNTTLYAYWKSAIPDYTYSGTSTTSTDSNYWYIYFTSDGKYTLKENAVVDVFLVGGGGGGAQNASGWRAGSGGGGAGLCADRAAGHRCRPAHRRFRLHRAGTLHRHVEF